MRLLVLIVAIVTLGVITCTDVYKWEIKDAEDVLQYLKTKEDVIELMTESVS